VAPDDVFCLNCGPGTVLQLDPAATSLCCPRCGARSVRPDLPLFVVAGVSGSGKTTVLESLRRRLRECELFDVDLILHVAALGWDTWRNTWLQLANAIAHNGRPTVLCGTFAPDQLTELPARRLVGPVYFCLLDAPHEVIATRLQARPAWRGATAEFIEAQRDFAAHLRAEITPVFDTSRLDADATAKCVADWIHGVLAEHGTGP
jgi:predicted kinase